jgi:hypothetical protein
MAKKAAGTKKDQAMTAGERALAEQLFVKLYDPTRSRTPEYFVTEAVKAAKAFCAICPSLTKE